MEEPTETHKATAPLAAVAALLNVVQAKILLGLAYAGPAPDFIAALLPFLSCGVGIFAARYAVQAWRATKAGESSHGTRGLMLTIAFAALFADLIVVAFAGFMALMVLNGPMVP